MALGIDGVGVELGIGVSGSLGIEGLGSGSALVRWSSVLGIDGREKNFPPVWVWSG